MDSHFIINNHIVKHLFNEYRGSEKKWTVILDDGYKYLLKFPDPIREMNREVSYINNAFSEYIGCKIYEILNIPVQKTKLGYFVTEDGTEKIACLCRDFRKEDEALFEIEKLELEQFNEVQSLSFSSIEKIVSNIDGLDYNAAMNFYYDMFVVDSLLGNTDRHNGNWGILVSPDSIRIAPVYDCGSSLSPLLSDDELTEARINNEAMNIKSIICDSGKRISYRDYIFQHNSKVDNALKRIVPRINLCKIKKIINDIPYISEVRKNFYCSLISIRYRNILIPALKEVLLQIDKTKEYKAWSTKILDEIWEKEMSLFAKLEDGTTQKIIFHNEEFSVIKNTDNIFLYKNDELLCMFSSCRSNKNISDFVHALQKINIDVVKLYGYPSLNDSKYSHTALKELEEFDEEQHEY